MYAHGFALAPQRTTVEPERCSPERCSPTRCSDCNGNGFVKRGDAFAGWNSGAAEPSDCAACGGVGWYGIDPAAPIPESHARQAERVKFLQARYAAGLPLWNDDDAREAVDDDDAPAAGERR